jgi:hypothetical protein
MASLYLYNPGEFWATVDKVDHHFQPLGANMLWPNFQVRGIIFLHTRVNSRFDNQVTHSNPAIFLSKNHLNLPYERHYNLLLIWNQFRFETTLDYKTRILGRKTFYYINSNANCSTIQTAVKNGVKNIQAAAYNGAQIYLNIFLPKRLKLVE